MQIPPITVDYGTKKWLVKEINKLLQQNDGQIPEVEICQIFDLQPYDIPWGHNIGWARALQPNQTYHLIQSKKEMRDDRVTLRRTHD